MGIENLGQWSRVWWRVCGMLWDEKTFVVWLSSDVCCLDVGVRLDSASLAKPPPYAFLEPFLRVVRVRAALVRF